MDDFKFDSSNFSERVFLFIKRMILSGEIKCGERIPELKIARQFGISRTPIREAMRRLSEYGLINIRPRSQAVVLNIDPEEAQQILEIHAFLEGMAVKLLAKKAQGDDWSVLERLADEYAQAISSGDRAASLEKDSQFHLEIARRSGNKHLYDIIERLDAKIQLIHLKYEMITNHNSDEALQHRVIAAKIKNHDAISAYLLIEEHTLQSMRIIEAFAGEARPEEQAVGAGVDK